MESRNKYSMCRLCLCENECFVNIFSSNDWNGYIAAQIISDLLQFEASKNDGYPHVICPSCLTKLTDFKVFKEQCQTSKVTYDNVFSSNKALIESAADGVEMVSVKVEPNDVVQDDNDDDGDNDDDDLSKESICGDDTDEQSRDYSPEVPLMEIKSESVDVMDDDGEQSKSNDESSQECRTPSPPPAGRLPKIRKRKSITMDLKLEIIRKLEAGVTPSALARTYSLNESTIRTIRKNASKTKEVELALGPYGGKKVMVGRNLAIEKMERLLSMWLEEKQWMDVTPSSTVAREKALRIYKRLQEEEGSSSSVGEPFMASKGWYAKFCKRRELQNASLTGEGGEMSVEFQSSVLASPDRSTSPLPSNYGPTHKRKVITLGRKLEIIEKLESGVSPAALGRVYQMNESSIRTIRKSAARIKESLARTSAVDAKQTQRVRNPLIEEMERCLLDWMEEQAQVGVLPNSGEARRKALNIYTSLKKKKKFRTNVEPFLASKGWYHRFCKRKNIPGTRTEGNDDSMSFDVS